MHSRDPAHALRCAPQGVRPEKERHQEPAPSLGTVVYCTCSSSHGGVFRNTPSRCMGCSVFRSTPGCKRLGAVVCGYALSRQTCFLNNLQRRTLINQEGHRSRSHPRVPLLNTNLRPLSVRSSQCGVSRFGVHPTDLPGRPCSFHGSRALGAGVGVCVHPAQLVHHLSGTSEWLVGLASAELETVMLRFLPSDLLSLSLTSCRSEFRSLFASCLPTFLFTVTSSFFLFFTGLPR